MNEKFDFAKFTELMIRNKKEALAYRDSFTNTKTSPLPLGEGIEGGGLNQEVNKGGGLNQEVNKEGELIKKKKTRTKGAKKIIPNKKKGLI